MKLSDYIAGFLAQHGVEHVFGLTGGAVVHLFDSVDRHPEMEPVFTHHEQAAAYAAEAYSRIRNKLGAAFVTTGPGGTNAITGVCAAWLDSIPCIYISGQTRLAHTTRNKPIRQVGSQQLDIVSLVKPITKYAVMIEDPGRIRYELEKAAHIAQTGRPGPVWIDIPLDFQWASIDPDSLPAFQPGLPDAPPRALPEQIRRCADLIEKAKRPLLLAGMGVRLAHAESEFIQFLEATRIPFLSTWNASDIYPNDSELYIGRPGVFGQRGANLAIQNCDLLLSIGSHLSIPITGTIFKAFAREAKVVMIDVDKAELDCANVHVELAIHSDAKTFLQDIVSLAPALQSNDIAEWRQASAGYRSRYNSIPAQWYEQAQFVNPYVLVDLLSDQLTAEDIVVVDGGGTINQIAFQAFRVKRGQRLIISSGLCAMGSGLPESVGACFAGGKRRTICLCGDGSLQLNIQELQTIVHHKLPVKIFVTNNDGYLSIRHTQAGFLGGNFSGSSKEGGMSLPDVRRVAEAYGVPAIRISCHNELKQGLTAFLGQPGPALCEIMVSRDSQVDPRQGFVERPDGTFAARPLEDMAPFLDRDEFMKNMFIGPWTE